LLKPDTLYPRSLQQKTVLFLLVPVFLFLTLAGFSGYRAMRALLLDQWGETALANLEKAAHQIDMQLHRPRQILSLLDGLSEKESASGIDEFIVERLSRLDGVVNVLVEWPEGGRNNSIRFMHRGTNRSWNKSWRFQNNKSMFDISSPVYDVKHGSETVSMVTDLIDKKNRTVGKVEVILDFKSLIAQTVQAPWWSIYQAFIVDQKGNILVDTNNNMDNTSIQQTGSFATSGILKQKTLNMLRDQTSGTVFGPGRPPEEVSGFYRLKEAPWTLVVIAPGDKILQPIIHFRKIYFLSSFLGIGVLLLFMRMMISRTTNSIKKLSQTAGDLAQGIFHEPLTVNSYDEVGELIRNFNTMTSQLQRGVQLQEAMAIASEVQLTLLPHEDYSENGLEVSGLSRYCDETGGDYYDFFRSCTHPEKFHIVVGDVVGHGIGAALLMATLRALVRANIDQPGTPEALIAKVNRQLFLDTASSGNFASLFYLCVDADACAIQWVRAGHDPAMLYTPETGKLIELDGKGIVLGLSEDFQYQTNSLALTPENSVLLIGSDGVWEAENAQGEQFGKERLKDLLRNSAHLSPRSLLNTITEAVDDFRKEVPLADDITLVAVSIDGKKLLCEV